MHKLHGYAAAGIVLALLAATPVPAASLLGGLITTGSDTGNGPGLLSTGSDGSIGVGGSNGVSVNLGGLTGGNSGGGGAVGGLVGGLTGGGDTGGSGGGGLLGGGGNGGGLLGGGGSVGVPGVAEVSIGAGNGGGSEVGVSLLGGGGASLSTNPLGLLGNGGGLNVSLPGLGGSGGSPGTPGAPGAPGAPGTPGAPGLAGGSGSNGFNGLGGSNGYNGFNGFNGRGGSNGGVVIPGNASSRLRSILAVLAQRDWIRMVNGRAICLANFGVAEVSGWLPRRDWAGLNAALPQYAQDIATLRQLLANCRSLSQRQALDVRDLNRVIGIDIARNGTPVLYML